MKKLFFTIIFSLLLGMNIQAQAYNPVIQEGSFWDVTEYGPGTGCVYKYKYRVTQDFEYNGITYKKMQVAPIRSSENSNNTLLCSPMGTLFVNENEFVDVDGKYIREDIVEKKVYLLIDDNSNNFTEYVMADFNLEVGETLTNSWAVDMIVSNISTSADGRKIFHLNNGHSFEEGVGSSYGPDQPYTMSLSSETRSVNCFGNAANPNMSCAATVLSTNDLQLDQINIFPNPTSDYISFTNLENNTFKLYSLLGKEMRVQFSEQTQQLDVSHLRSGIYLLEIQGEQGARRTLKVIKQ